MINRDSISHRKSFLYVEVFVNGVEERNGQVFHGNGGLFFVIKNGVVLARPIGARPLSGVEHDGGAQKSPVEVFLRLQDVQVVPRGLGSGLPLRGELGGIHQLHTGCDFQATGSADDEEAFYTGFTGSFLDRLGRLYKVLV